MIHAPVAHAISATKNSSEYEPALSSGSVSSNAVTSSAN